MSKDFEQAYKEAAQMEAPDLWDRIEAGLQNKSVPEKNVILEKKDRKKYSGKIFNYSGLIAAAVCVAVIIPAAVLLRQTSKGYSASGVTEETAESLYTGADEDTAGAEPKDEKIAESNMAMAAETGEDRDMGMEGEAGTGSGDNVAMTTADAETDAGVVEETVKQSAAENAAIENGGIVEECAKDEVSDSAARAEKMLQGESQPEQSGEKEKTAGLKDGAIIEHAVIKVTELKEYVDKEGETDSGILCTAVFQRIASDSQQDMSDLQKNMLSLQEDGKLTIYVPSDIQAPVCEDGVFEVDLEYQSGGNYSFVLRKYHRETK